MIGQIGPSVRVGQKSDLIWNCFGSVLGSLATGLLLSSVGLAFLAIINVSSSARVASASTLLVAGAFIDSGVVHRPRFGPARQTPLAWVCSLGRSGAAFAWGLDLGAGLTTRLPYFALTGVMVAAAFMGSLSDGILIFGSYGAGRAVSLIAATTWPIDQADSCAVLGRWSRTVGIAVSLASLIVACLGFAFAVA